MKNWSIRVGIIIISIFIAQGSFGLTPTETPTIHPTVTPEPPTVTPSPTFSCFLAGTRVDTPDGLIPIEDISAGDIIYAVDPESGMKYAAPVQTMWRAEQEEYLHLRTSDNAEVFVTAHHPFYDEETGDFKEIGAYEPGDSLTRLDESGKTYPYITGMTWIHESVEVFHPTVDNPFHTFLAEGFIVHNKTPTYTRTPTRTPTPTHTPTPTPTFSACFLAGSRVDTPDGMTPIEDIEPGDIIYAVNPSTGEKYAAPVQTMWRVEQPEYIHVRTSADIDIYVTEHHPFYDEESGKFVEIGDYCLGDSLTRITDSAKSFPQIMGITRIRETVEVFHPTVDNPFHTFLVEGFIVHNKTPTVTATPTFTRTPNILTTTPTPCLPGLPVIDATLQSVDDTFGQCSDADGMMDAGEIAQIVVAFKNIGSMWGTDCRATASTDNALVRIEPEVIVLEDLDVDDIAEVVFTVTIDSTVLCNDLVTFQFHTFGTYCDTEYDSIYTSELSLDLDHDGAGTKCDEYPCEEYTPAPITHGMELSLDDRLLESGDVFRLHYTLLNSTEQAQVMDAWILLEVFGEFWCYPSWKHLDEGVDFNPGIQVEPLENYSEDVLIFIWPESMGSAYGLRFFGAAVDPAQNQIVGSLQTIPWGYQ